MSNTMKDAMAKAGVNTNNKATGGTGKTKAVKRHNPLPNVSNVIHGSIKWFDFHKGYGFITADNGEEFFVYHKHIVLGRTYTGFDPGDRVTFRTVVDPDTKRTSAVTVSLEMDDDATDADPDTATE